MADAGDSMYKFKIDKSEKLSYRLTHCKYMGSFFAIFFVNAHGQLNPHSLIRSG